MLFVDVDIDECESIPCVNGDCVNTPGSYECKCQAGYYLEDDTCLGTTCNPIQINRINVDLIGSVDVNECEWRPCVNGTCTNVPGSFKCSCAPGLQLNANTKTCTGKRRPKFKLN